MRTPALIAKALGWPEAKRTESAWIRSMFAAQDRITALEKIVEGVCRAPGPHWTPGSRCVRKVGHKGVHRADNTVVWSPDERLRLVVTSNHPDDGWWYQLVNRDGWGRGSFAPTQPAALALGLAALDTVKDHR